MARDVDATTVAELQAASDAHLLLLHDHLLANVFAQVLRLEREQRRFASELDAKLVHRLFYRKDGEGVTAASQRAVDRTVAASTAEAEASFKRRFDYAVLRTTLEKAQAVIASLRERGYASISNDRLAEIAREVAKSDTMSFGAKPSTRIRRVVAAHKSRVDALVRSQADTGGTEHAAVRSTEARARVLQAGSAKIGDAPTRGGAVTKDMSRLLVSEAMRKSFDTERAIMGAVGVEFAYRRLSSSHVFRGRSEVCEELCADVYPEIEELLDAAGYDPRSIDLRGLYPLPRMPGYPHPWCKCWVEPLDAAGG